MWHVKEHLVRLIPVLLQRPDLARLACVMKVDGLDIDVGVEGVPC